MVTEKRCNGVLASEIKNRNPNIPPLFPDVIIDNLSVTECCMILSEAIRAVEFELSYKLRDSNDDLLMRKKDWFEQVCNVMAESQVTYDGCFSLGEEHRLALFYARQELNDYMEEINAAYARLTQTLDVM